MTKKAVLAAIAAKQYPIEFFIRSKDSGYDDVVIYEHIIFYSPDTDRSVEYRISNKTGLIDKLEKIDGINQCAIKSWSKEYMFLTEKKWLYFLANSIYV